MVVTLIVPVVASPGTAASIRVGEATKNSAGVPLKATSETFVNPVPVSVTQSPIPAGGGVDAIVSGIEKSVALAAEPAGLVTTSFPVTASAGTTARSCVGETGTIPAASAPPKVTPVTESRFVPATVTVLPA